MSDDKDEAHQKYGDVFYIGDILHSNVCMQICDWCIKTPMYSYGKEAAITIQYNIGSPMGDFQLAFPEAQK